MHRMDIFSITIALLFAAASISGTAQAQIPDGDYFPETGYWVRGPFLDFFNSADAPLLLFGYPISDQFYDPTVGREIQYFQRARLEMVGDESNPKITIDPLGMHLYVEGEGQEALIQSPACRDFPQTGKHVCYSFLDFFDAHGGHKYFGDPISEGEVHNGRYLQYFENARMEWRPEMPSGERVALSDLGKIYYDSFGYQPKSSISPENGNPIPLNPVPLQTHAFVTNALLTANSQQTLTVIVQDHDYNPIDGAEIEVIVHIPEDPAVIYHPESTNVDGISSMAFDIGDVPLNEIIRIEVNSISGSVEAQTETWFRVWW
jgi:hypothetical protein